jgi:acyl dehydratase
MLTRLLAAADLQLEGASRGMNYGFDTVRMLSPVRAGKRIRGRFVLHSLGERAPRQWLAVIGAGVEIEGESKSALVADWLGLQFLA